MPGISPQPHLIHETQHDPSLASPDPEITQPRRTRSQTAAVVLAAFDIQAVYNRDKHQVTIHATITDATPQAVLDLLTDPRADHSRQPAPQPASSLAPAPQDHVAHLTGHTGSSPRANTSVRRGRVCGLHFRV
jgi:hypothetical protein